MVSLEDKILGFRADNFCSSSSEDEAEANMPVAAPRPSPRFQGTSANTGPKGVLEDWRAYERLKFVEEQERKARLIERIKQTSMFCATDREKAAVEEKSKSEEDLEELFAEDDDMIKHFAKKRMDQLRAKFDNNSGLSYGSVRELPGKEQLLSVIEDESTKTTVFIHLYENDARGCSAMDECFRDLAVHYRHLLFCRCRASTVGMSQIFRRNGLPTIQVYKGSELVLNLVRCTDYLGEDFFADDLARVLEEYAVLSTSPRADNC